MPTIAPQPNKREFTLAPKGTHIAQCISFIHIGTNMEEYMGAPKEFNKIRLTFELPHETKVMKEGEPAKPLAISQEYTLSMAPKANLRKLVEGILGVALHDHEADSFDTETLVGMPCLITVIHKTSKAGNERAEIANASPLMKGQSAPAQVNPSKILSYSNWDKELFEAQPNFIKEKIMTSKEYKNMQGGNPTVQTIDPSEIPF